MKQGLSACLAVYQQRKGLDQVSSASLLPCKAGPIPERWALFRGVGNWSETHLERVFNELPLFIQFKINSDNIVHRLSGPHRCLNPVQAFWKLLLFCSTKIRIRPVQETALEHKPLAMEAFCRGASKPLTKYL